ncbi:MAG: oligosaccharide flippase family protein [Holdemanella porci]
MIWIEGVLKYEKYFSDFEFLWRFAERCGAQLVTFIVSIVLARILSPNDYGTIALVTVFITILQVFIDSGLSTALIQKKDADDLDFFICFLF